MKLELETLRTILIVREAGSVTAAAERLQRAQSTVSYALNCARAAFDDELFVREGKGLVPTPRCLEILPRIEGIVHELRDILAPEQFDPATQAAEVIISCNQYEQAILLPGLIARARAQAPLLQLKVIRSHTRGQDQLLSGECDILLSPLKADRLDVFGALLFSDHYVCVSDSRNGLPEDGLDLEEYLRRNHVSITHGGYWRPFFLKMLPGGDRLHVAVELCSATNLFEVLAGTDLIATIPSRLAATVPSGLTISPGPFETAFDIHLFYTRRTRNHPAAQWVRRAITEIARAQPGIMPAAAAVPPTRPRPPAD